MDARYAEKKETLFFALDVETKFALTVTMKSKENALNALKMT